MVTNSAFIGNNAGSKVTEGDNIVIIGDDILDLDRNQSNVLFLGKNVAIGEYLFGVKINLKEVIEKLTIDKKINRNTFIGYCSQYKTTTGTNTLVMGFPQKNGGK